MIKQVNGKFTLFSKDSSKRLGKPGTEEEAKKREKQVNYFKHLKKSGYLPK